MELPSSVFISPHALPYMALKERARVEAKPYTAFQCKQHDIGKIMLPESKSSATFENDRRAKRHALRWTCLQKSSPFCPSDFKIPAKFKSASPYNMTDIVPFLIIARMSVPGRSGSRETLWPSYHWYVIECTETCHFFLPNIHSLI